MSTLPNLMMDISSRIAKARGPVDMNLLMTEIHESPLADGAEIGSSPPAVLQCDSSLRAMVARAINLCFAHT